MRTLTFLVMAFFSALFFAQDRPDIKHYLTRIEEGESEAVQEEIPSLLERYPNNPAVLYLQGRVTADGAEAVRIFQGIVDNFAHSEWADDALYRVYQFYYAIGLYRTAELKMNQLKKEYPNSEYIASASEVDTGKLAEESGEEATAPASPEVVGESKELRGGSPGVQGQFTLQVGAYASEENAETQKLFFEDLGHPVEVINRLKGSRSLFLVLVGNFMTYEEAKAKAAEIRKSYNIDAFVVSREHAERGNKE